MKVKEKTFLLMIEMFQGFLHLAQK